MVYFEKKNIRDCCQIHTPFAVYLSGGRNRCAVCDAGVGSGRKLRNRYDM